MIIIYIIILYNNIRELCPPFHQFIVNTYQKPAILVVSDGQKTEYMVC